MRGRSSRRFRTSVLVVALGALTVACGQQVRTSDAGVPVPDTPEPTGSDPVLQVAHVGGFLPVGAAFSQVPALTVYADGRAITHGPQIMIFPGPALPNLLVHELSDEQLRALQDLAADAGLLASPPPSYGDPPVADAATTVVALRFGDDSVVHQAYALGIGEGRGPGEDLPGLDLPGLDAEAVEARQALSDFVDAASTLVTGSGEAETYQPDAFAVLARAVPPDEPAPDAGVEPDVVTWPLPEVELAGTTEECVVLDQQATDVLRDTLQDATQLTRFEQDGQVYDVFTRALLPGEDTCPEAPPARP